MALKIFVIMILISLLSSGIGGIISCLIKVGNKNVVAALYEFTAGIMTSIVCFDMLPECFEISSIFLTIIGVIMGTLVIIYIEEKVSVKKYKKYNRVSLILLIAMSFHNFIEGIAIGSSYIYSVVLGTKILVSMVLHDIPESMVVGITSKVDTNRNKETIFNSIVCGIFTGIGALFGYLIGDLNSRYIAICLSIAAGSMLYIVSSDLIPNSNKISKNKKVYVVYIVGILIGAIITKI